MPRGPGPAAEGSEVMASIGDPRCPRCGSLLHVICRDGPSWGTTPLTPDPSMYPERDAELASLRSEVADLRTRLARVVEAAGEYRRKTEFCMTSEDCTIADEEERDALQDALDAVLAEEVGRG